MVMQWTTRALAVAVSLFLALFALDAPGIRDTMIHLVPSAIVVIIVALSWRREWIGAAAFTGMAIAYAVTAREHLSWIAVISGPLFAVGALYTWTWTHRHAS
jgi:hypothetical protein